MTNKLFIVLLELVVADCLLTAVAVGHLEFTEPNPVFAFCGGFSTFMVVKIFASLSCLIAMYILYNSSPKVADVFISTLCVLYGVVVFGGAALLVFIYL